MTLEEAAAHIGRQAIYTPHDYEHAPDGIETGVIRYGTDQHSKATSPGQLRLAGGP